MPDSSASSEVLLRTFGAYHLAALQGGGAAVASVREPFEVRQGALEAALQARIAAGQALSGAEALRVAAETDVERLILRVELVMLGAVGKKRDRDPYKTAFPKGTQGAIAPKGRAQVVEARRIVQFVRDTPAAAGIPPEAATIIAEAQLAIAALETRVVAEETAQAAESAAFLSELAERRGWREQYRKGHGLLTAIHGLDKRAIEASFKKIAKKRKKGDTEPPRS